MAYMDAKPDAMLSPLVGSIAAGLARSYQSASEEEYVATLARLYRASMCVFSADAAVDVIGCLRSGRIYQLQPVTGRSGSWRTDAVQIRAS